MTITNFAVFSLPIMWECHYHFYCAIRLLFLAVDEDFVEGEAIIPEAWFAADADELRLDVLVAQVKAIALKLAVFLRDKTHLHLATAHYFPSDDRRGDETYEVILRNVPVSRFFRCGRPAE